MDIIHYLYQRNITLPYRINPDGKKIRGIKPVDKQSYYQYNFEDGLSFLDVFDVNKSELYQENGNEIYTDYRQLYTIYHNITKEFQQRGFSLFLK
jgi:hypothetical protein